MILTHSEETILKALASKSDARLLANSHIKGFSSGAQLMQVIRELDSKGLVDFREGYISLTEKGLSEIDHSMGRSKRQAAKIVAFLVAPVKILMPIMTFVIGLISGFLLDNLAPRTYCAWFPNSAAWLTPCQDLQGESP